MNADIFKGKWKQLRGEVKQWWGDLTDDDDLNNMGDQMLGMITAGPYSAAHDSALNKAYVAGIQKANGFRPDFVSLGGYDGLHLIYEALKKTGGKTDGEALTAAVKGMKWESPRGPIAIDPDTRDIIQTVYIRRVERTTPLSINGRVEPCSRGGGPPYQG